MSAGKKPPKPAKPDPTKPEALNLKALEQSAKKTGFVLEHRVTTTLRAAGWSVLSNRYYLDDQSGVAREIDLIAYRAGQVDRVHVYTVLIVSCKKNEQNAWALMARPYVPDPLNVPVRPVHLWTNDKAVEFFRSQKDWPDFYHESAVKLGVKVFPVPRVDIFAFQEMAKNDGTPKNDKNIFESIAGLMKAQAYEIDSLPERRREPALYQFNLLSVVDAPLVALEYADGTSDPKAKEVNEEHYIARYIVNRKATFARIHFLRETAFAKAIGQYDALHKANTKIVEGRVAQFYADILQDEARVNVLKDEFATAVRDGWGWPIIGITGWQRPKDISVGWGGTNKQASVYLSFPEATIERLRIDPKVQGLIASALEAVYRYSGSFTIMTDDIPF